MEKKWMRTEQMLEVLKAEPDVEQQYCHTHGGILRSTHWLIYSSDKNQIAESTDWNEYDWFSEPEFLAFHPRELWLREY